MTETITPGLPGDWLNGWLAGLGVTVLLPDSTLRWTDDIVPKAVIAGTSDLEDALAAALVEARIAELAIARDHPQAGMPLPRNVDRAAYRERAALTRTTHEPSLAASLTDLAADGEGEAEHSPFDPPAPKGETLHDRLLRCWSALDEENLPARLVGTLSGAGQRIQANGLGFDHRRLSGAADGFKLTVDPVVEVLAYFGTWLFPVRGDGRRSRARGWTSAPSRRGAFTWPIWAPALDCWSIDALLDRWYSEGRRAIRFGVSGSYHTVAYQPKGTSDVTRAYTAQRSAV